MTVTKKWTVIPGFLALAAAATLLSAYSGASSSQGLRVEQPVKFVHAPHVAKAGMNCLYCHSAANKAPDPGNASVQTCMGCHVYVKPASAEIKKVADFYNKNLPIPWNRVHSPIACGSAHAPCQRRCHLPELPWRSRSRRAGTGYQLRRAAVKSLNMGWCISCHVNG
jgi:hypothetical protein